MTSLASICVAIPVVVWAQNQRNVDFAALIRTPADIQATLERCDGHPEFETALANWLETAKPRSLAEEEAIRQTSLRLLEDTTDQQLALGLISGLLQHALAAVKRDPAIIPKQHAQALYADIGRAVRRHKSKAKESAMLASVLGEDLTDARQAGFVKEFTTLAERPAARRVGTTNAAVSARIPATSGQ